MKIAFFVPHFSEGGLERSTLLLAEEMTRQGDEAVLITLNGAGRMLPMWPGLDGVRVLGRGTTFAAIPTLSRLLRREYFDAVVSAQDHANVATVLARILSRRKILLILTERLSLRAAMKTRGRFRRLVLRRLTAYAYPRADVVLANSIDGAREIESVLSWESGRAKTIYNPTASSSIDDLAREFVDDSWFEEGASPVLMGLGRLVEQKDFATLIEALALTRNSVDCRLVIFGDGPLRSDLEDLAEDLDVGDYVRIEPFVENPYKYLSRATVFVLSSRFEGLPNSLIEAQVCGVPTVSTDCPTGPREILEGGSSGVLVPVGDAQAVASAVTDVISDRTLARKYVDSAASGLDRFRPAKCYSEYKKIIEQLQTS